MLLAKQQQEQLLGAEAGATPGRAGEPENPVLPDLPAPATQPATQPAPAAETHRVLQAQLQNLPWPPMGEFMFGPDRSEIARSSPEQARVTYMLARTCRPGEAGPSTSRAEVVNTKDLMKQAVREEMARIRMEEERGEPLRLSECQMADSGFAKLCLDLQGLAQERLRVFFGLCPK